MEALILIFLGLMFAHLLADYPLQGEFLANFKGKNPIILVAHAGIWTGCVTIAGLLMGLDIGLLDVTLLFVVHTIVDYLKAANKLYYKKLQPLQGGLLIDQLIHVGQVVLLMLMTI